MTDSQVNAISFWTDVLIIGELRVDLLDVYSGILFDNKACYHGPMGFTALL